MKNGFCWIGWVCLLFLLVACAENEPLGSTQQRAVQLRVHLMHPTRKTAIHDPGQDHDEYHPDWHTMAVYLAYANGKVSSYAFSRDTYQEQADSLLIMAEEGQVRVFAVTFGGEQTFERITSWKGLRDLSTLDLSVVNDRKNYMLSLYSGCSENDFTIDKEAEGTPVLTLTLHRLVAKVDVQYDVQDAYELGGYTQAVMSRITFRGAERGFFFPNEAVGASSPGLNDIQVNSTAAVSERNGRCTFYTFPGMQNTFDFSVTYAGDGPLQGEKSYQARFSQPLEQNTWHYVQLNVSGSRTDVVGEIELVGN